MNTNMPSESPQVSPVAPTRLSSIRLSGIPNSPSRSSTPNHFMPPALSSRHSRAMTAGELHNAMEQEQEHITNNLLKHIDQLRADKIRIEHELESESEAVMNRLTRELSNLRTRLEAAGVPTPAENPTTAGTGSQTPRTPSRSPSRASSVSRGMCDTNSPRLNPTLASTSPVVVPIISPLPRRGSTETRSRAPSNTIPSGVSLNGETHGLERVIESLRIENGDIKRAFRELDDRFRCKQAECERHKEEIQNLKMEIQLLQRRASIPENGVPSVVTSMNPERIASSSVVASNVATTGSPDPKKSIIPDKKNSNGNTDGQKNGC